MQCPYKYRYCHAKIRLINCFVSSIKLDNSFMCVSHLEHEMRGEIVHSCFFSLKVISSQSVRSYSRVPLTRKKLYLRRPSTMRNCCIYLLPEIKVSKVFAMFEWKPFWSCIFYCWNNDTHNEWNNYHESCCKSGSVLHIMVSRKVFKTRLIQ